MDYCSRNYHVTALLTRRYEMVIEAADEAEARAKAKSFDYLWGTDLEVIDLKIESVRRFQPGIREW